MGDQEETLVLNYLVEELQLPQESDDEIESELKIDEHYDENQNTKNPVKEEILTATPPKKKISEDQRLTRSLKRNRSLTEDATKNTKKRKGEVTPELNKMNGLKSPESKKLVQKKLEFLPKTKTSISNSDNVPETVIKVENDDIDDVPKANDKESEDNEMKYESASQIHTEFKYESQSETEENVKKKKQTVPKKNNNSMKSFKKNLDALKNQTKLDGFINNFQEKPKSKISQNGLFKCDKSNCSYIGNSKANLERHMLIHMDPNDILWYKCTDCEYKSKYEHQLKSHTIIHKNPDEISYFQCPHCDLKCSRKHNLNNHIRTIHADRENSFHCAECNYSTFSKDRLAAHIKKHTTEVFMCNLCKFVTKRKKYLDNHYKLKHTEVERPFPCDTCSYKAKTKRELERHHDRMHNKEKLQTFQCNHCDFNSIYKKNLEFHLLHMHQNSEGFQKFICGHCKKEFSYKNGLKTHIIRIHLKLTDADWHKCQDCKYKSKDVNTLKRHITRNHGAPRLHCKECSFATNRQKSMTAHMKTHDADPEDILKCPECPYRIIKHLSFIYHMRVLHGKVLANKDIYQYYLKDD